MKKIFLKTLLLCSSVLLFNCQNDDAVEANPIESKKLIITSEKVSYDEVVSHIKNFDIKGISQEIKRDQNGSLTQRTSQEELLYFDKIVKGEQYTTYSLQLSTYTPETPYFQYYIITQDSITEKAGYVKYVPDTAVAVLDMKTFTGTVELSDIETNVVAECYFINGIAQEEQQQTNVNARTVGADGCVTTVKIITHNCTNGGNHPPGTSCAEGKTNDGYYEIVTTVVCPELHQNNSVRVPDQFMGGGGTGSGSAVAPYPFQFSLTKFTNSLSLKQGEWWLHPANSNVKQNILKYLEENYFSEESKAFVKKMISLAIANNSVFTFDDSLNLANSLNFNSVEEFQAYLGNVNNNIASNISLLNNDVNTKTARFSFDLGLFCYLNVQVKQKLQPQFSIENISSSISGATLGTEWAQNDDFDMTINGNVVTVTFTGTLSLNCFVEGIGVFFSDYVTITVKLNKTTGAVISGTLTGLE